MLAFLEEKKKVMLREIMPPPVFVRKTTDLTANLIPFHSMRFTENWASLILGDFFH